MKTEVIKYFDSVAPIYADRSQRGLGKWLRRRESAILKRSLGAGSLGDVLELGSGSGYYSRHIYNQGCQSLTCVDISTQMLDNLEIPGCVKVNADIQNYLSENCFDIVLCAGALEFLECPEAVFSHAAQMLRPNGFLLILMPRASFFGKMYQLFHRVHGLKIGLFKMADIQTWAQQANLSMVEYRTVPLFSFFAKLTVQAEVKV